MFYIWRLFVFKGRAVWRGGKAVVVIAKAAAIWTETRISLYVSSGRAPGALLTEPGHMQFFLLHSVHKFVPSVNTVGPLQVSFLARRRKISSSKSANSCSRSCYKSSDGRATSITGDTFIQSVLDVVQGKAMQAKKLAYIFKETSVFDDLHTSSPQAILTFPTYLGAVLWHAT